MTINGEKMLNFMKEHYGNEYSKDELAKNLKIPLSSVIGSINPLIKKGYVATTREETVELEPATETRKAKTKVVKYHTITDAGLAYDPIAEEEEKRAAKLMAQEEAKARRKAAKEAKVDNILNTPPADF